MSPRPERSVAPLPRTGLAAEDVERLVALCDRGTPETTRRAYKADLAYLAAWKDAAYGAPLAWPETDAVALRFILDHAEDLTEAAPDHPGRIVANRLIALRLRRRRDAPSPATLDRRIATWRSLHRLKNLTSPFDAPLVREARRKARIALARPRRRHSAHPITADVLSELIAAMPDDMRGRRDRAMFAFAFASGGRRRSEIAGLHRRMIGLERFARDGVIDIRLSGTKTTGRDATPPLVLSGRAAALMADWISRAGISGGSAFRAISRSGRVLERGLTETGVAHALRTRLAAIGRPTGWASPHGLRSGFLTEAARQGIPIQAAMRLSLHKSPQQAMAYYDEASLDANPATALLDRRSS